MYTTELKLYQYKKGYRYNSDSIFLYDFLTVCLTKGSILDIGCGCGILGLLLKRDFPNFHVDMIDVQEKNVILSCKNALENGLDVNISQCDFKEFDESRKYDFLVSNPPFYHDGTKQSENSHLAVSRYSTNLPFEDMAKKSYRILNPKGRFCFCYDGAPIAKVLHDLTINRFGLEYLRFIHPKKDKNASRILVIAKKDFKGVCKILPPLISNINNEHSMEARNIFKKINTVSITWEK